MLAAAYEISLARLQIEAPRTADLRAPASGVGAVRTVHAVQKPTRCGDDGTGHGVTQCSLYLAARPGLTDSSCPVGIYRLVKTLVAHRIGRKLPSKCDRKLRNLSLDAVVAATALTELNR